nr:uncharacterized protein LOC110376263 isoform X2 [Helicoverpa armigera]
MNCFIIIFLALIALSRQGKLQSTYEQDEKLSADRESQFYCYKLKTCTPDDQKVCGYDPHEPWLAVFADICTMYKANCDKKGRFKLVDQVVCDTRIAYDKEHVNEEFEWIHLSTTTKKPNITTTIDLPQKAPQGKVKLVL